MCQDAAIGEAGFHEKLPWAAVCVLFRHYPNSLVYMRLLELLARAPHDMELLWKVSSL